MGPAAAGDAGGVKEESSFSEEKEAKRLLSVRGGTASIPLAQAVPASRGKSFLVLFFKKEQFFSRSCS
jgi:hypothetical protein